MILLRRVIGDALRARRQSQRRTLREVSTAANVSLGYLSEIERGQKEASSELLSAICEALGAAQSEVLRAASDTLAVAERTDAVIVPLLDGDRSATVPAETVPGRKDSDVVADVSAVIDGEVSVAVHRAGPLRTTLCATRAKGSRRVVRAA
ncbi:MAG: helix-turn-helix transcriptional regulator [Dactylosporangium sp.]|nr:helix-turn-helix domain-containing protein [Dactylosporangium sp.]NNJ61786.1 helix-turn-helix transcriptional regulator [Dactylosporangium sp.]